MSAAVHSSILPKPQKTLQIDKCRFSVDFFERSHSTPNCVPFFGQFGKNTAVAFRSVFHCVNIGPICVVRLKREQYKHIDFERSIPIDNQMRPECPRT